MSSPRTPRIKLTLKARPVEQEKPASDAENVDAEGETSEQERRRRDDTSPLSDASEDAYEPPKKADGSPTWRTKGNKRRRNEVESDDDELVEEVPDTQGKCFEMKFKRRKRLLIHL
jgi:hypothetical protein